MTLLQLLKTGAVLRYRPGLRAGRVRPESTGPDGFGVYHFALRNTQ